MDKLRSLAYEWPPHSARTRHDADGSGTMRQFTGKVALVTGGGSGVGRALVLECAREGMKVVVADIDAASAQAVADESRAVGVEALAVQVDVAEREAVEALAEQAYAEFGEVNLLFQNAGVSKPSPLTEPAFNDWNWLLSVNLWGVLHGIYAFLPRMRAQAGEAHIVNTASVSGLVARQNQNGIYTSVKHALVGLTNVLRDELEPEGIVVSCWCPGGMLTRMGDSGRNRQERFGGPYPERPRPVERQPNPILPEEVAPRVLALVREDRRYILTHPATRPTVEAYYQQIWDDYDAAERVIAELESTKS